MRDTPDTSRRELLALLADLPLFAGLGSAALSAIADEVRWVALPGGATLFEQDEPSDGLFVLLHGRLAATRREPDGRVRTLGSVTPGECVGETSLLVGEPRSAKITALRDCELLHLSLQGFEQLAARFPQAMLAMARLALRRYTVNRAAAPTLSCIAVLPAMHGVDTHGFARRLAAAYAHAGEQGEPPALILPHEGRDKPPGWFGEREAASKRLLYVGDDDPLWRERCARQSDCVLLLADASRVPQLVDRLPLPPRSAHIPYHLVLLQRDGVRPGSARDWREALPQCREHHHVRGDRDVARLARRLEGRARGLVLSGGGARGFAHLGAIRALREAGMEFDHVGGASIGAIVGAGVALDWDDAQMADTYRRYFVITDPLRDWTVPLVSLRGGRRVAARLRAAFGNVEIEDLPLPYFCVSSDLTEGMLEVHEHGPLWRWLRASSAIPGILPPVFSSNRVLVDGGVIDNLPVSELRRRMAGEIVAIDVGGNYRLECGLEESELPPWWQLLPEVFGTRTRPGIGQILLRAGMVNSAATAQRRRKQTRLLLSPPLEGIDLLDWRAFDRAVQAGYDDTRRRIDELGGLGFLDTE